MDFNNTTILVIGDLMLDEYITGRNYHMSSEAPVPVLRVDNFEVKLGGAANVAHNLHALGCNVMLCGVIGHRDGSDHGIRHLGKGYSARRFIDLMERIGLSLDLIVEDNYRTTTKTRILINHQQVARYDHEQLSIDAKISQAILDKITDIQYDNIDIIIVSDYNKGVISEEVMDILRSKSIPIIIDPKPTNVHMYHKSFCLTPNAQEFSDMSNQPVDNNEQLIIAAQEFINQLQLNKLIVTRGTEGVFYCDKYTNEFIPGCKKEVVNIIGAGDTFIAVFGASIASGMNCIDSIKLANLGASIVVSKPYTNVCSLEELNYCEQKNDTA